jgi:hypothetical protein
MDGQKNKIMFVELSEATFEPRGKDDLAISNHTAGGGKKMYFKALDTRERDEWLNAILAEK